MNFEIGKEYFGRFATNHDSVLCVKVVKRTEKTVTITSDSGLVRGEKRCKIHRAEIDGAEFIFPTGRYSMAIVINAV